MFLTSRVNNVSHFILSDSSSMKLIYVSPDEVKSRVTLVLSYNSILLFSLEPKQTILAFFLFFFSPSIVLQIHSDHFLALHISNIINCPYTYDTVFVISKIPRKLLQNVKNYSNSLYTIINLIDMQCPLNIFHRLIKACMQVEHLAQFMFIKTKGNYQDTLVGRLAKQQRTNNINYRNVLIQISVRLALFALTACQLTPYGPIALVIHSTWSVVCHCKTVFRFFQQTHRACTNICSICFTQLYSGCWMNFVDHRFVLETQVLLEKSACEEGRIF